MFQQGFFQIDPNTTPDQIKRKREAIQRAMNRGPAQYAGEGLTHLAGGIASLFKNRRLDDFETQKREEADGTFASIFGAIPSSAATPSGQTYPAPAPSVSTEPLPQDVGDSTMEMLIRTGLEQRGLPAHLQDAFIMNMQDESGLNPGINELEPLVPGSRGGFGLMQWTGPRRRQLEAFAQQRGKPVSDVDTQLDFMMQELATTEVNAAQSIFGAADAGSAATAIVNKFLRPAEEHRARRAARYGGGRGAASQVAQNVGNIQNIAEAMSDPWIMQDQGKAAILQMMLGNAMTPASPGYRQVTGADLGMTGDAANSMFNVGPDGKISAIGGAATNINVNTGDQGPQVGTIPQGYQLVGSPETGYRMEAIPGGPEDTSLNEAATQSARDTASDNVLTAASRARSAAGDRNGPTALTGIVGRINPYSDSAEVLRQVSVLRNITSAEQLNAMRRQSKTGGALGNVTERELTLLAEQGGALDPNSPNFLRDLADYERAILRTIHGKEAGDTIFEQSRGNGWTDLGGGVRVRPKQ